MCNGECSDCHGYDGCPLMIEMEHDEWLEEQMKEDFKQMPRVLVVGSRTFADKNLLFEVLDHIHNSNNPIEIVAGGCPTGADSFAKEYAQKSRPLTPQNLYTEFPAEWEKHGRAAGYIRNKKMHEYISQFPNRICIAFWDGKSKGTAHSFELAKQYDNPICVIRYNEMDKAKIITVISECLSHN